MRFRLKKVGEAILEASAASEAQAVLESAGVPGEPPPFPSHTALAGS